MCVNVIIISILAGSLPPPTEPDWAPREYLEKGGHYLKYY